MFEPSAMQSGKEGRFSLSSRSRNRSEIVRKTCVFTKDTEQCAGMSQVHNMPDGVLGYSMVAGRVRRPGNAISARSLSPS